MLSGRSITAVMVLLHDSVDFKKLDVRLVERNIARGTVTPEELRKSLETLPDDSVNADWIDISTLAEDPDMELNGTTS